MFSKWLQQFHWDGETFMRSNYLENIIVSSEKFEQEKEYWLCKLSGEAVVSGFPSVRHSPKTMEYDKQNLPFKLPEEVCGKIHAISGKSELGIYMILVSGVMYLLSRYTGSEDIIVGAPLLQQGSVKGILNNVLPLRNKVASHVSFKDFLVEVRKTVVEANTYCNIPFGKLVELTGMQTGEACLFKTMVLLENIHSKENIEDICPETVFCFSVLSGSIECRLEYNGKLFTVETLQQIQKHLIGFYREVTVSPGMMLSEVELLSSEEKERILCTFNNSQSLYPRDKTVHRLFEEQAGKNPHNIAVVCEDVSITYGQLNTQANMLAMMLREKGVNVENIVGILMEPSIEMITGILGILKAGAAYMPIDPGSPGEKIKYMLSDSKAVILLTQSFLRDRAAGVHGDIMELDTYKTQEDDGSNPDPASKPENAAYVIYTSGTTGAPKGVLIENRSIVNYAGWLIKAAGITDKDSVALVSSYAFDLGYSGLYTSLLGGGRLHMAARDTYADPQRLLEYIYDNNITYMKATPSLFNILIHSYKFPMQRYCKSLRLVILGGEQANIEDIEKFHLQYPGAQVMNHYGPTEATVGSIASFIDLKNLEQYKQCPYIGKPINNTKIYILDKLLRPVPIGAAGEICIAGDGLARGYINQPHLTGQKFISNPFSEGKSRLYKTGDMGRYSANGSIEFLGRNDTQVKVNGYRVEPGEVEFHLLKHPEVIEAVVMANEDHNGNKYLCAYIVCGTEPAVSEIKDYLGRYLPHYMVPLYFVKLEKIPLTPNGKVDRRALAQHGGALDPGRKYEAPQNEMEEKLVEIWRKLLGIERIGIDDNFFEVGGHSLNATILTFMIYKELNREIPLRQFFMTPTIRQLSEYIRNTVSEEFKFKSERLVLLKKGTNPVQHLFLIHDGSGEIDGYIEFCNTTGPWHYWGIRTVKGLAPRNIPIEDIAGQYIQDIKGIQERGPYYLAGWSVGGTIAFEIARQFENAGEKVAFLGLFDSVSYQVEIVGQKQEFTVKSELQFIREHLSSGKVSGELGGKESESVDQLWSAMINAIDDSPLKDEIIGKMKTSLPEDMNKMIPALQNLSLSELISCVNTWRTLNNARAGYIPQGRITTAVHFFKAGRSNLIDENVWNLYCKNPIKFFTVEGSHYSIFKLPDVIELRKVFEEALEKSFVDIL